VNPIKVWYSEDQLNPRIKELMKPIQPDFELLIMYPVHKFQEIHRKAAIITMYEADRCPTEWVKALNNLGIPIFAPSKFVQDMFERSEVKVPVKHLQLGVDTNFYKKKRRRFPEGTFKFLTIGKLEPRKNVNITTWAFQEAFSMQPLGVELVIKTRERFLPREVKEAAAKDKRITIIEKTMTEQELLDLYYSCHCFVYPSRGEGFAFPPRNAVATGMPTIVTDWSALAEIPAAYKIGFQTLSPMHPCGFSYGQEKELLMANIDDDALALAMQDFWANKELYRYVSNTTYDSIQNSWNDCARDLEELIYDS
jgi:glycosyltransferase involved in cell wall biosynthesis